MASRAAGLEAPIAVTPTETEIAFAWRLVVAFEKASAKGSSSIQLAG